uniref:Class I SAM-dependent methyltransferase n=1 Tax=Plectus sambesii TaxID=2011161 RepID=A0A914X7Y5_9BILA
MGRATRPKPKSFLLLALGVVCTVMIILTGLSPKELLHRMGFAYLELRKHVNDWKAGEQLFSQPCWNVKSLDWTQFLDEVLHREDIYSQFDVTDYTADMQGWAELDNSFTFYMKQWLERYPNAIEPVRIIEVGSFKGRSTITMGEICKKLAFTRQCSILAVDTWTGSAEFYETAYFGGQEQLAANGGILHLFETFLRNVKKAGVDDVITPLRLPSLSAAHVLHCLGLDADFVFIDADHEYEAVKRDLSLYYQLLRPGGYIFGDDWRVYWPGVQKAVLEFVATNNLTLLDNSNLDPTTWVVLRPA